MEIGPLPEYWPLFFPDAEKVLMAVTEDQRVQGIEECDALRVVVKGGALDGQVCVLVRVHVDDADLAAIESAHGFWMRLLGSGMHPTDFLLEIKRHEGVIAAQSACPSCLTPITSEEWKRRRLGLLTPADDESEGKTEDDRALRAQEGDASV